MILSNFEEDMNDNRSKFSKILVMPTSKTVSAIVPKFLSAICQPLKVDHFEGFINQSIITHLMIHKTSS